MTSNNTPKIKVAILDDYASVAPTHFHDLTDTVQIDHFDQTLNPQIPSDLENLVTRLRPYRVISTMRERTPFQRPLLSRLPNLQLLLTTGTRNAGLDLQTCRELGVVVAGTGVKPNSVAGHSDTNEQTWALLLGLAKNVAEDDLRLKSDGGSWQRPGELVFGLMGKTLGVLGLGKLGLQCAVTGAMGFGMEVVAWSTNLTQEKADEAVVARGMSRGSVRVLGSKEELMRTADVLSLHVVLSERTRGIVGREELGMMKRTALLINTSRGPLVDEAALLDTLREGRIRGAAMDVFDTEPLPSDSPWRSLEWGKDGRSHVLLSPHAGYIEEDTINWMYKQNAENLRRWLGGRELMEIMT